MCGTFSLVLLLVGDPAAESRDLRCCHNLPGYPKLKAMPTLAQSQELQPRFVQPSCPCLRHGRLMASLLQTWPQLQKTSSKMIVLWELSRIQPLACNRRNKYEIKGQEAKSSASSGLKRRTLMKRTCSARAQISSLQRPALSDNSRTFDLRLVRVLHHHFSY